MKALGVATALVLTLFFGIVVWALIKGTPLSGEPTALLQIHDDKNQVKTASNDVMPSEAETDMSGGQAQVLIDVTPREKSGSRIINSYGGSVSDGLIQPSKFGPLPKRAKNGRTPAGAYARKGPGRLDTKPRIAVLLTGLGLNQRLSKRAMQSMPADVSLAFSAYGRHLGELINKAKSRGHELMLQVPMEPLDYPESDTGPKTLLVSQNMQTNLRLLHWSLGRFTGYFGIVNNKGGRYLAKKNAVVGLFKELQQRGLFFFHDSARRGATLSKMAERVGLGYSQATLEIDQKPSREGLMQAFGKLEAVARRTGIAVGVAQMHPVSIDMISRWAKGLESRGFRLVPVSSIYQHQEGF